MSPLAQAVASNKQQSVGAAQSGAVGASTLPQSSGMLQTDGSTSPPQITEEELRVLEERAAAGDAEALSLLEALGYVAGAGGVAAGGYALYQAMKGRSGSNQGGTSGTGMNVPRFGGDDIIDAEFQDVPRLGRDPRTGFTIRPPDQIPGPTGPRIGSGTVVTPVPPRQQALPGSNIVYQPAPQEPLYLTDQNAPGRERAKEAELDGWRKRLQEKYKTTRIIRSLRR
jgi:hypothetical protein